MIFEISLDKLNNLSDLDLPSHIKYFKKLFGEKYYINQIAMDILNYQNTDENFDKIANQLTSLADKSIKKL